MATQSAPIQGIAAPDVVVSPQDFYRATRRMRFAMSALKPIAALGSTDTVQLRQVGIVSSLEVRVQGSLTFGGTIGTTTMSFDWPYNLIQNLTLSANGQSNLISARGLTLKAYDFVASPRLDDAGVSNTFNGAVAAAGTLAMPSDVWGATGGNVTAPGSNVAAIGTYNFDLTFVVPVAADQTSLVGSIYAQSSATNLSLNITWATQNQIVSALGGAATFASTINWQVTGVAYSIPNVNGKFVVPDLSQFHQLVENRTGGLVQGSNQIILPGTGVGRQLLRLMWNTYSGAPFAPLAMNATNYGQVDWAYGGSDVPEAYPNGTQLRAWNIHAAGTDIGGLWGFGLWDFASVFALRDSVDEGATTNLRLEFVLNNAPTSGFVQTAQETLFAAPVGA